MTRNVDSTDCSDMIGDYHPGGSCGNGHMERRYGYVTRMSTETFQWVTLIVLALILLTVLMPFTPWRRP